MEDNVFSEKIKELRESTGLNRKEFCEKFEIPYRTMTEWELGHRNAPPYVLRLLAYYVEMQAKLGEKDLDSRREVDGYE
ncbi:MAG: helix-turn-helix transcriptional regulator [Pseudobutyrivibrio ruminis]|uniref:helix-turn-helix domain-containing protein n=1 Tax=Pseudobutyrivibrio ruminis TaxID=46206 RepID=UPI0026F00070|nr:helix-turn-helix transcriptional regulator [Pseudobutyrivibrio ruminis]MBE5912699.1 helix-turn-helix transcriptional regulator [Pseudobutyrivibrio ruminis]